MHQYKRNKTHERRAEEFRKMKSLEKEADALTIYPASETSHSNEYIVCLKRRVITGITAYGKPQYDENCFLRIKIPPSYPKQPAICITQRDESCLFHPHFKIKNKTPNYYSIIKRFFGSQQQPSTYSIWEDYKQNTKNESVTCFTLRIARSILFYPEYIDIHSVNIGNRRALKWYKFARDKYVESFFPISSLGIKSSSSICEEKNGEYLKKNRQLDFPDGEEIGDVQKQQEKRFEIVEEKNFSLDKEFSSYLTLDEIDAIFDQVRDSLKHVHGAEYYGDSVYENNSYNYHVLISQSAQSKIHHHIDWGEYTPSNRREQGGLLLGRIIDSDKRTFGVVTDSVTSTNAAGDPQSLEMDHDTWRDMLEKIDDRKEDHEYSLSVIGWYHTHPNNLDVFMSHTDINTQSAFFNQRWHFALVLNPHRKVWKAFHGPEAKPCSGAVVDLGDFD